MTRQQRQRQCNDTGFIFFKKTHWNYERSSVKPQNTLISNVLCSYNCGLNIACLGMITLGEKRKKENKRKKRVIFDCMEMKRGSICLVFVIHLTSVGTIWSRFTKLCDCSSLHPHSGTMPYFHEPTHLLSHRSQKVQQGLGCTETQ